MKRDTLGTVATLNVKTLNVKKKVEVEHFHIIGPSIVLLMMNLVELGTSI